ncbi:hypothetical protein ACWELB_21020 [Streptomyces asiaticus]
MHRTIAGPAVTCPDCKNQTCHTCRFWLEKISWHEAGDAFPGDTSIAVARVDSVHFVVRPMNSTLPARHLGLGGRQITFRFNDGQTVTSNDVMCQGDIPAWFRSRLPDNAVIVSQSTAGSRALFGPAEGIDTDQATSAPAEESR